MKICLKNLKNCNHMPYIHSVNAGENGTIRSLKHGCDGQLIVNENGVQGDLKAFFKYRLGKTHLHIYTTFLLYCGSRQICYSRANPFATSVWSCDG